MNRIVASSVGPLAVLLAASTTFGQGLSREEATAVIRETQQSHLDENVPTQDDFDRLLRRDLSAYFTETGKSPAVVDYELLRDGPTEAGIAFPKYYVWVTVTGSEKSVSQGAAIVAAVDRERFEVTHFISINQVRDNPGALNSVFPSSVVARIEEKALNAR